MRPLAHPLAPLAGAVLAAAAYLVVQPATADMAAHAFRAWLFDSEGMTVWNAQWYGGHHVLGYSMLFAPLAAWPGPAWVGALGAVAATALFVPLARAAAPTPGAAAGATWLFAAGVLSNVVIGRMPFTLGIALAVGAWLCAEQAGRAWRRARRRPRARLRAGEPGGGRVPGAGGGGAGGRSGRAELGRAAVLVVPVAVGGATMATLFPEGGDDRFVATAFWPMLAVAVAGAALLAPAGARCAPARCCTSAVLVAAFVIPTPFGQNALRLPVLLGPALLVLAPRAARRAAAIAAWSSRSSTCSGCPPCARSAEAHGDPSTEASFFDRAARVPRGRRRSRASAWRWRSRTTTGRRRTWPPRSRWRAAGSASSTRRPTRCSTTAARSRPALPPLAARRRRALGRAPGRAARLLGRSAEARLLEQGVPYLRVVHRSPGWRIWEVRDPEPPASDGARITAADPAGFEVEAAARPWCASATRAGGAPTARA